SATVTSAANGSACTGVPQNYAITSDVPGATFTWSRNAFLGNPAVTNQTTNTITETLTNNSPTAVGIDYFITPVVGGCPGTTFVYFVIIYPSVPTPIANSSSPVCAGSDLNLQSPTIP